MQPQAFELRIYYKSQEHFVSKAKPVHSVDYAPSVSQSLEVIMMALGELYCRRNLHGKSGLNTGSSFWHECRPESAVAPHLQSDLPDWKRKHNISLKWKTSEKCEHKQGKLKVLILCAAVKEDREMVSTVSKELENLSSCFIFFKSIVQNDSRFLS